MADNLDPKPTSAYSVAKVVITPSPVTLSLSGTQQLTATAKDASNNTVNGVNFSWESRNPAVASVNASGLVTAFAGILEPHTQGKGSHRTGGTTQVYAYVQRGDGSVIDIHSFVTVTVNGN